MFWEEWYLVLSDGSGAGNIVRHDEFFMAIIQGVLSRQGRSCYAIAVRDGGISDIAKNTAFGVVTIHNERVRALAFPATLLFSLPSLNALVDSQRYRSSGSPENRFTRMRWLCVDSLALRSSQKSHLGHSQKAAWVSQRLIRQGS